MTLPIGHAFMLSAMPKTIFLCMGVPATADVPACWCALQPGAYT